MLTVNLFIRCAIAALVAATAPLTALAQDSDVRTPTPPDPSVTAPTSAKQASISYLSRRYSISAQEAERRLSLQGEVAQLRDRLAASLGSDLGRIRIQHAGEYRVIVETLNPARTTSQLDGVSTELRAAIQVVEVRRSGQDVSARVDELATLLKTGGVAARLGFDPLTDKFEVTVADEAALLRARALVPAAMLTDVVMAVGLMPRDAQAGYVSGDYTYGGWLLYHTSSDSPLCTTGFVVRLSDARYGVTTAGHCTQSNRLWINGHYVTLASAGIAFDGGLYDYRVYLTGSLTISGNVAYTNNQAVRGYPDLVNYVPGYANRGNLSIKDGLYSVGAGYGAVVCKNGQRTHLTCGEVVDTYVSYTSSNGTQRNGMVAVGYSYERVPGYQGDSGGPVFAEEPDGTVRPVGLMSSANGPTSGGPCDTTIYTGCEFYYMPVDRINDQQPMQLKTAGGQLNPT